MFSRFLLVTSRTFTFNQAFQAACPLIRQFVSAVWPSKVAEHGVQGAHQEGRTDVSGHGVGQADGHFTRRTEATSWARL